MKSFKTTGLCAVWLMVAVAACDQVEPPSDMDAGNPKDYYPLVNGATWTYWHSSKQGWQETVTMTRSADEANTYKTTVTPNTEGVRNENTLVVDGTSVFRVAKTAFKNDVPQFSVSYDPGFLRFDTSWLDSADDFEDTREYTRTETDADGNPETPHNREHTFVVQSTDATITVAGRTFRNCVRILRQKEADPDVTESSLSDTQEKIFWFAPQVGKIREENLTNRNVEELIDYDIP